MHPHETVKNDPTEPAMCYCESCVKVRTDRYAEGYKAGRIATLREVGCLRGTYAGMFGGCLPRCAVCRLLAEAESGEDTGEVGDDR